MKNKKKIFIIIVLVLVLSLVGSFALWTYSRTLSNQTLISGDIFLKYTEGDTVNIKEAMPSVTYNPDDYFEFTVEGKNKYKKDVVFEIFIDEGDKPTGKENESRNVRIKPELLKFRLVEVKGKEEEELIQAGSYNDLNKKRIWVDRVKANTTDEIKYTYRLYMWISNDAKIGNMEGADYTAEVWNNNVFASVKVGVNGDFEEKELTEDYFILNAKNESGVPYDLNTPVQSDEDITLTLASKREVTKFVVSKSSEYPIALTSLDSPTDYTASYNETTRAWEATITLDETGIYDYYAVYPENKGQSKTYSFTLLFNPDRFVEVAKPTSELCKPNLTYTGSPQNLIDESNLDKQGYTIEQVQGTDAQDYQVKAHLKEKFRWSDSSQEDATFNCTIGPKETVLTYEPASDFKVSKDGKSTFKINAPTEGTFEVTSQASGTASVTFEPSSGTSTSVTVQGVAEGSTTLNVKFTPTSKNYAEKIDTYSVEVTKQSADIIKEQIASHSTDGTNLTVEDSDGTIYLSGTNEQINFNYVWYSGKLWRITAINPDNTIKMITQEMITAITWNTNTTYSETAWIYQWLNEDFLDTLENQENIIVQNEKWNATLDETPYGATPPVQKPETLSNQKIVEGNVGLLNAYEYYQSYKNLGTDSTAYGSGYLNIGYDCWLITPYNSSSVRVVYYTGGLNYYSSSFANGVRPSITLKSDIKISGGGTKENPYRISGDKEVAKVNDKLNSRVSGEYVNFDGKKYRIVGIENETTKLASVDYVRDDSGAVMKKRFSSGTSNYSSVGTSTTYWAGYLNDETSNGWYGSISDEYKIMLVEGTYYLQIVDDASYKNSICSTTNTTDTIKECDKTSRTWTGYVGLPREGEMFSSQLGEGYNLSSGMWLITPHSSIHVAVAQGNGFLGGFTADTELLGVRPSIYLNSNVVITSVEGTLEKPYGIKLAN